MVREQGTLQFRTQLRGPLPHLIQEAGVNEYALGMGKLRSQAEPELGAGHFSSSPASVVPNQAYGAWVSRSLAPLHRWDHQD